MMAAHGITATWRCKMLGVVARWLSAGVAVVTLVVWFVHLATGPDEVGWGWLLFAPVGAACLFTIFLYAQGNPLLTGLFILGSIGRILSASLSDAMGPPEYRKQLVILNGVFIILALGGVFLSEDERE